MVSPLMLFAGSRLDAGFVFTGAAQPATGGDGTFDPTYSDSSVSLPAAACAATAYGRDASGALAPVGLGKSFAARAFILFERGIVYFGVPIMVAFDSAGYPWFRAFPNPANDGTTWFQYNSGTGASPVWTTLATYPGWGGFIDLMVKLNVSGTHNILWAINASTAYSGSVSIPGLTDLASVTYYAIDGGRSTWVSEVMLAQDISLVNARLKTIRATGAGTYAEWAGTAADVNEVVPNDGNFNYSDTAGQRQSYDMTTVTVPAGYSIGGLFYAVRGRNDGFTSPTNIKALLRSGASDYLSADLTPIDPAFGAEQTRWDVDPATGVAWTQSGINAAELGFQSAA